MSLKDDIIQAIESIGGEGHYTDIYDAVKRIKGKGDLAKNWKASIRGMVEKFSKNSKSYIGKEDLFYSVDGLGKGIWGINNYKPTINNIDLIEDAIEFAEGKTMLKEHIMRERHPKVIRLAKEKFKKDKYRLFCEVCGFDFEKEYGELGKDFIEGHHSRPISELKTNETTKAEDIVMVCSNCHKMLHRKRPWLNKDELKLLKEGVRN